MQRRKPRILAAIGLTAAALALPAVAGASYIPDVLRLGPDAGYRFNDDQPVHSPGDDGLADEWVLDDEDIDWLPDASLEVYVDDDGYVIGWHAPDGTATRLGPDRYPGTEWMP